MKKKSRVFQVVNQLKQKVGIGGFSAAGIARAQQRLDACSGSPKLFEQIAETTLVDMARILRAYESGKAVKPEDLRVCVLDLKANGQMFGYKSITAICADVLDIIQGLDGVNDDVMALFNSLYMSVKAVLDNKITNAENKVVVHFDMEIGRACARYRQKHGLKSRIFKK